MRELTLQTDIYFYYYQIIFLKIVESKNTASNIVSIPHTNTPGLLRGVLELHDFRQHAVAQVALVGEAVDHAEGLGHRLREVWDYILLVSIICT